MTWILAAVDDSAAAEPVVCTAVAIAATLGVDVRAVHVREGGAGTAEATAAHHGVAIEVLEHGDPIAVILERARAPGTEAVVVGTRDEEAGERPAGHVALQTFVGSTTPVVAVPPDGRLPTGGRISAVLLAMEGGTPADGCSPIVRRLADHGVAVVGVHVFGRPDVPAFWDQPGHAEASWSAEFLARWSSDPAVALQLRSGDVAGSILDVAEREAVDLVALEWSQRLLPDRAHVVRDVVTRATLPILLAPLGHGPSIRPAGGTGR
jgi:nucleotide-binding universal stress UspA family protein